MFRLLFISVIFYIFPLIQAIEVESNSPCHSTCGAPSTPAGALTCQDNGYNTTNDGRKMQACLECESTSTISNPSNGNDTGKADLYWFMCKWLVSIVPLPSFGSSVLLHMSRDHRAHLPFSQHEIYPRILPLSAG